jgi:hypothetical protein
VASFGTHIRTLIRVRVKSRSLVMFLKVVQIVVVTQRASSSIAPEVPIRMRWKDWTLPRCC